jgi:hypothetical protein
VIFILQSQSFMIVTISLLFRVDAAQQNVLGRYIT